MSVKARPKPLSPTISGILTLKSGLQARKRQKNHHALATEGRANVKMATTASLDPLQVQRKWEMSDKESTERLTHYET